MSIAVTCARIAATLLRMHDKLTIFIGLVAVAILIQAGVLLGMFLAVRKMQSSFEALQKRALPIIDQGKEVAIDLAPKVRQISTDALRISVLAREQAEEVAQTARTINLRTRAHVARADEVLNSTLSRVEKTTENVQTKVMTPVRKFNAVVAGISAAMDSLRGVEPAGRPRHWGDGDFVG
ncbi:MAG: hypothetical protein JOZ43_01020 [Acidobacteriales bacterium]|nr:hypothetical protein [Terriglobales bacterium]